MSRFRSLLYLCMDKESLLSVAFPCIFELYCLHGHCTGVATSAYETVFNVKPPRAWTGMRHSRHSQNNATAILKI